MPANLPPQYFTLSAKLKEAKTLEEKISILEKMLAICPKHKGTEKVQRDLKTRIAKLKRQIQPKKKGKKELIYIVKKEGAGQVAISGPPNSGKSTLLNSLTNANIKTAAYPFTTTLPQPAMMPYEDILIQLIDTPPLTKNFCPGWLKEILKNADTILAVFDSSKKDLKKEIEEFKEILENLKIENKKTIFIGNKIDLITKEKIDEILPLLDKKISVLKKIGLEDLKRKIFETLEIVRIYSKKPNRKSDLENPFILRKGAKLIDLITEIHHDLAFKFKYARLFKRNTKTIKIIGKDYVLEDGDIVEIHS